MSKRLRDALVAVHAAQRTADRVLIEDYPVGAEIRWQMGADCTSPIYTGTVLMHGYSDRVQVRNDRTQREYWIHAFKVFPG